MNLNVSLLLLSLQLSCALSTAITAAGVWTPIKDLNDPHVQEIAQFAVSEYNVRSKEGLKVKLEKVVKGETQLVSGTNYRLVLDITAGTASQKYQAVVWEKPWMHFRQLTSFTPVNQN